MPATATNVSLPSGKKSVLAKEGAANSTEIFKSSGNTTSRHQFVSQIVPRFYLHFWLYTELLMWRTQLCFLTIPSQCYTAPFGKRKKRYFIKQKLSVQYVMCWQEKKLVFNIFQEQDADLNLKNSASKQTTLVYLHWILSNTLALLLPQDWMIF